METRNIFIDASILIGRNFNYKSAVIENLCRLRKANQAKVFLTDIAVREVRSHIEENVSKAVHASSKFKNDARIFRNIDDSPYNEFFQDVDEQKVVERLNAQLDEFLNEVDATILPTSEVSIDAVFDKYFGKEPPFGDGKKKSEFPDAFSIEALEDWCKENQEKMYVVSSDGDLKRHCETSDKLRSISKLSGFIDIVEFHDQVLAPSVSTLLAHKHALIEQAISESFCWQGFWIDDQEGEVDGVTVNDIELLETHLLEVDAESAVVEVAVKTHFSADLSYDDLETAYYDSEDKVLVPRGTIEKAIEQEVKYSATVQILHNVGDPDYLEIQEVEIDTEGGWGFAVSSGEYDWAYE